MLLENIEKFINATCRSLYKLLGAFYIVASLYALIGSLALYIIYPDSNFHSFWYVLIYSALTFLAGILLIWGKQIMNLLKRRILS